LDENGNIKLCDFGISGNLINSNVLSRNTAGCAGYMAPERIDPVDPAYPVYDTRADIWSLGITLVELGTGQYPYKNCSTEFEVMTTILTQDAPVLNGEQFSENFRSFVNQCLIKQVKDRPKYNVLMKHSFIQHYKSMEVDVKSWLRSVLESNNTIKQTKNAAVCNFPGGLDIDKASLSSLDLNGENNSSSTLSTPTVASVSVTSFN
jgi:mitogen-activated protein kinase kinase 7